MPTTSNFGWTTPADTDLVKDGAAAIRTLGNGVDASFVDLKGGTTGQVLAKASNTDLDFNWIAVDPLTILDAKGDLISATAADTPARLAVGTNGQVLTADSTQSTGLSWTTPSSGSMTLLASSTQAGTVSTFDFSSISGSYQHLQLVIRGYYAAADNKELWLRFNSDTGSNYYFDQQTGVGATTWGNTYIALDDGTKSGNTKSNFVYTFWDYANTSTWKMMSGINIVADTTTPTSLRYGTVKGFWNNVNAISTITVTNNASNITGSFYLYGVK